MLDKPECSRVSLTTGASAASDPFAHALPYVPLPAIGVPPASEPGADALVGCMRGLGGAPQRCEVNRSNGAIRWPRIVPFASQSKHCATMPPPDEVHASAINPSFKKTAVRDREGRIHAVAAYVKVRNTVLARVDADA